MDGLEEEKYDLVLCSYQENRNNINFVPITTEELVVVVSKLNPLALKNEIDLQELQNEYFIYYTQFVKEIQLLFHGGRFFFFMPRNVFLLLFYPGFPQELPLKAD